MLICKVGVLMATIALSGLWATSANAAEWHTNGPLTQASTNAGALRLAIHSDSGATVLGCTTSSIHLALNGPTSTFTPWISAATLTPSFSGCTLAGSAGYSLVCAPAALRAFSYAGGTTFATAGGGVTTGSVASIDCRYGFGATTCSTVTGTIPAHFINPNPIASGVARLTLTATGQLLQAHKIGSGCAFVPDGQATIGGPGAGSAITDLTFTVEGPDAPYIYRTP
jgi:hypothetical protein